jgi:hypothetical protein
MTSNTSIYNKNNAYYLFHRGEPPLCVIHDILKDYDKDTHILLLKVV